jgi:hypothetical protein
MNIANRSPAHSSPQIFQNLGLSSTDSGLFATGIYGVVSIATSVREYTH